MARSNSPRAHVRTHVNNVLAATKRQISSLQDVWTSRSYVFETFTDPQTGRRNGRQVPRPAEDYPENRRADLTRTIADIDNMIKGLTMLRDQLNTVRNHTP